MTGPEIDRFGIFFSNPFGSLSLHGRPDNCNHFAANDTSLAPHHAQMPVFNCYCYCRWYLRQSIRSETRLAACARSHHSQPLAAWGTRRGANLGTEIDTTTAKENLIAGRPLIRLGNVSTPTLTLYTPQGKNTG